MRGRWRNASIISYQEALRAWNVFQHLQHHFAPDIVRTYHILHVWSVCELPFSAFSPRFFLSSSLLIYSIRRCDEPKRVKRRPWEEAVGFVFKRKCFTMPQPRTFYPEQHGMLYNQQTNQRTGSAKIFEKENVTTTAISLAQSSSDPDVIHIPTCFGQRLKHWRYAGIRWWSFDRLIARHRTILNTIKGHFCVRIPQLFLNI